MPTDEPLPTIANFLTAFAGAVTGTLDVNGDVRRGSVYDQQNGVGAVLFSREVQRDRDLFRAVYFDTAQGHQLEERASRVYQVTRIQDAFGVGVATFARATSSAGLGTVWTGTRVALSNPLSLDPPLLYVVTADTPMGPSDLSAQVPVRAMVVGPGTAIQWGGFGDSFYQASVVDPLWDASLTVTGLSVADGTFLETPQALRARSRQTRADRRNGRRKRMTDVLASVGATHVALFQSFDAGDASDTGLNVCYVGDDSFTGTTKLVQAATAALEGSRVMGADLMVLPMAPYALTVSATITLWDSLNNFDVPTLTRATTGALLNYFDGRTNPYLFSFDDMGAAISKVSTDVQNVTFALPTVEPRLVSTAWPNPIFRYSLTPNNITLSIQGPS